MKDYSHVTMMLSLPRSRSQWMAWLFREKSKITSWHDPLKECEHPRDLVKIIDRHPAGHKLFIADTAAILFRDYLGNALPGMKTIFVSRHPTVVLQSIAASAGRPTGRVAYNLVHRAHRRMQEHNGQSNFYDYQALDSDIVVQLIYERVTGQLPLMSRIEAARKVVIDVPILHQRVDPVKAEKLLQFSEISLY